MVGAVLVYDNRVIAEGYHRVFGGAHAEVEALLKVKDSGVLEKCTLYVSLEPCNHYGKTPPCSEMIVSSKIPRVVVAAQDPFEKVNGSGIERLKNAGVDVVVGIMEKEARELNRRFFTFHEKRRPYVILKWAQTEDNFIDRIRTKEEKPLPISNNIAHVLSHKWRTQESAILVGTNTAIMDNPSLTARLWDGRNPTRVAIDVKDVLPYTLKIFVEDAPTLVLSQSNLEDWMLELHKRNIQSVMVEGGARLLQSFIEKNMWDEARIFTSTKRIGSGVGSPKISGRVVSQDVLEDDVLTVLRNL
jgi:diaminohydroxyphosphoribosylaminopyrimidine deaminase/5-amino-6-(5-phosphoribosylamino)uracil reductase